MASAKFGYASMLYDAMEDEATDGIYEGKVVETFQKLGLSMSFYTPLFNVLKELNCIHLLDRGVRGRPTRYRLNGRPSRKAYEKKFGGDYLTPRYKRATVGTDELDKRVTQIERRLQGIDIKEAILNLEERIEKLEGGSN